MAPNPLFTIYRTVEERRKYMCTHCQRSIIHARAYLNGRAFGVHTLRCLRFLPVSGLIENNTEPFKRHVVHPWAPLIYYGSCLFYNSDPFLPFGDAPKTVTLLCRTFFMYTRRTHTDMSDYARRSRNVRRVGDGERGRRRGRAGLCSVSEQQ